MKKIALAIIAVISVLVMSFALAACSSDVAGNTYKFNDIKVTYSDDVTDLEKITAEAVVGGMKEALKNASVTFEKDGTCKMSEGGDEEPEIAYYKQDGDKIYIFSTKEDLEAGNTDEAVSELKVNGSKIEMSMEENGTTMTMIYKK